jgi:transcriptional regulator with XRE-family HTH domain
VQAVELPRSQNTVSLCMQLPSLGEKIKDLRSQLGISLRELARRSEMSAPHLSDIELGRRYPSDEALTRLAKELGVEAAELRQFDNRDSLGDMRRMMTANPTWGLAFKKMAEGGKSGTLTPEEVLRKLTKKKD